MLVFNKLERFKFVEIKKLESQFLKTIKSPTSRQVATSKLPTKGTTFKLPALRHVATPSPEPICHAVEDIMWGLRYLSPIRMHTLKGCLSQPRRMPSQPTSVLFSCQLLSQGFFSFSGRTDILNISKTEFCKH